MGPEHSYLKESGLAEYKYIEDSDALDAFWMLSGLEGIIPAYEEVEGFLEDFRSVTDLPLALGFGLSDAGQVVKIKDKCNGIIMGNKLLDIILKADDLDMGLRELEKFVGEIIRILKP